MSASAYKRDTKAKSFRKNRGSKMGGSGSGNWLRLDKKRVVEDCLCLTAGELVRLGLFKPWTQGSLAWRNPETGEERASAGFSVRPYGDSLVFTLDYPLIRGEEREPVQLPIRMVSTRPYFGGRRWWFVCPLIVRGIACNRRAGKLYLPPGAKYFGCRKCHDLTYTSCQEAHQSEWLFAWLWERMRK